MLLAVPLLARQAWCHAQGCAQSAHVMRAQGAAAWRGPAIEPQAQMLSLSHALRCLAPG